jgi:hypothetical protein
MIRLLGVDCSVSSSHRALTHIHGDEFPACNPRLGNCGTFSGSRAASGLSAATAICSNRHSLVLFVCLAFCHEYWRQRKSCRVVFSLENLGWRTTKGKFAMETKENKNTRKQKAELKERESQIDRQMKESFPASDPPSFSGGNHIIGAPKERESRSPKPESRAVKDAERKVKVGSAKEPTTY